MTDQFNRKINYLRLAVTDRCNLRCSYCMPEKGLEWLNRSAIMSFEEMIRISDLLIRMGIDKIRITGGEPFLRKDIDLLLSGLSNNRLLNQISITTNGTLTEPFVGEFRKWKINSCNLSLDTLDRETFFSITKRDEFDSVISTMNRLLSEGIEVKINCVVMEKINIDSIADMVELTRNLPVSVRFIEEMPFNGDLKSFSGNFWNHLKILEHMRALYPEIRKTEDPAHSTAYHYSIPGHKGNIGIIAAYSRSFCGSCNRLRLRPDGGFQTCLYGNPVFNVKDMMRSGLTDEDITKFMINAVQLKEKDGWEAESMAKQRQSIFSSMATIGG